MSLKLRIQEDMKVAMKAQDATRLSAIRLIWADLRKREIDERIELDDAGIIAVLNKMLKQRQESVSQYQMANRQDLVQKEESEISVIRTYLPEPLSDAEVDALVTQVLQELKVTSMKDMGKAMTALRDKLAGRADMSKISTLLKAKLS